MFPTNNRYATQGVIAHIRSDLQSILWRLIDQRKREGQELDHLQIFYLTFDCSLGYVIQKITHTQEVPNYSKTHLYTVGQPVCHTVWVIDSGEYATMLLPSEY
jgi:hypothetical protein